MWVTKRKELLKGQWSNGDFFDKDQFAAAIRNAGAVGECQMADRILNLDFEDFHGDMSND